MTAPGEQYDLAAELVTKCSPPIGEGTTAEAVPGGARMWVMDTPENRATLERLCSVLLGLMSETERGGRRAIDRRLRRIS
jgi:hypothetical protein